MGSSYNIDTTNRRWADPADGQPVAQLPVLFYKNLTEWTLQFVTNSGNGAPVNDTRFASLAAFSASGDNDFIHTLDGLIVETTLSGAITELTISGITVTPPATGEIILENAAGQRETISYTNVVASGANYVFTVAVTLTYSYVAGDDGDVKEALMFKIENSAINSTGKATGLFVLEIDTDTRAYLIATLNQSQAVEPYFEFVGYDGLGNKVETFQVPIVCRNIIENDAATPPPAPTSSYYTKTESDALLDGKVDLVGADDVEITDAAKGLILKSSNAARVRLTITHISGSSHQITLTEL